MFDIRKLRKESISAWHDMRHRVIIGLVGAALIFILPIIVGA